MSLLYLLWNHVPSSNTRHHISPKHLLLTCPLFPWSTRPINSRLQQPNNGTMPFFPAHKKLEPLNPTQHYTTLVTESSSACLWSLWQSLACFVTKWSNTIPPEISLLTLNQENQYLCFKDGFLFCLSSLYRILSRSSHYYDKQPQRPVGKKKCIFQKCT